MTYCVCWFALASTTVTLVLFPIYLVSEHRNIIQTPSKQCQLIFYFFFNFVCGPNQMEEQLRILESSQIELKKTFEHNGKLLTEILQCLENLQTAQSLTRKMTQEDDVGGEHGLWPCSICTNDDAKAAPFKFDRPSADAVSAEKHSFGTMSKAKSAWLALSKVPSNASEKKSAAGVRIQQLKMKYTNEKERIYELLGLKRQREELLFTLQEVQRRIGLVCFGDLMYRALQEIDVARAKLEWNTKEDLMLTEIAGRLQQPTWSFLLLGPTHVGKT